MHVKMEHAKNEFIKKKKLGKKIISTSCMHVLLGNRYDMYT